MYSLFFEDYNNVNDNIPTVEEFLESINIVQPYFLNENISIKEKLFKQKQEENINKLKNYGLDTDNILKQCKMCGSNVVQIIKKSKLTKESFKNTSRLIQKEVEKTKKNIITRITDSIQDFIEENIDGKTARSIVLLSMVLVANTIMNTISILLFGFTIGNTITVVLFGPITEEIAKLVAVKMEKDNTGKNYNVIFNAFEFSSYVLSMVSLGISLPKAIIIRIPALILHTINTFIISKKYKHDEKKNDKDDNKGSLAIILTVIIHGVFNALGWKFNDNIINKILNF